MLKSFLSLFLKSNCPLCQRPTTDLICQYCQQKLKKCQFLDRTKFWHGDLRLWVWGSYQGELKRAIAAFKYEDQREIGKILGTWLGQSWLNSKVINKQHKLIVVPIPLHPSKLKERGFNQAELIAQSFCQITGYSLQSQGLERVKKTEALFGLTPLARQEQLDQAFQIGKIWQKQVPRFPVLLLDDIYTTGTTVKEATQVLRKQGIQVYGITAIATSKKA